MDRSVLDEVIAAIEPPDESVAQAARARLGAARAGLGRLAELGVTLSAQRRRVGPPVERAVIVAVAADLGAPDPAARAALEAAATGASPLAVLCRAAGARMLLVDAGLAGAADADLGAGVVALRVGDGLAAAGAMSELQALVAVQSGIALVLSLVSEGLDLLGLGDLAPAGRAAAPGLREALASLPAAADPLAALVAAGGLQHGVLAGLCLGAAATRVPVVLDGPSADAAGRLAARLAPGALAYQLDAASAVIDAGVTRGDGSGAALAVPTIGLAARALRELR